MTTHDDLQRDMGRVEGAMAAVEKHLDRLSGEMSEGFKSVHERLDRLEKREAERKGAWTTIVAVASAVGGVVTWLISHFIK